MDADDSNDYHKLPEPKGPMALDALREPTLPGTRRGPASPRRTNSASPRIKVQGWAGCRPSDFQWLHRVYRGTHRAKGDRPWLTRSSSLASRTHCSRRSNERSWTLSRTAKSDKVIAHKLGITESTVKQQVIAIRGKLDTSITRVELAVWWLGMMPRNQRNEVLDNIVAKRPITVSSAPKAP